MSKKPTKQMLTRAVALMMATIILGFGAGIVSLAKIQLIHGDEYRQKAEFQQLGDSSVAAQRGTIYDCNMRILAQSATAWKVFIDPSRMSAKPDDDATEAKIKEVEAENAVKREKICTELSEMLGVDKEMLIKRALKTSTGFQVVKNQVELEEKNKVSKYISDNKYYDCIGINPDTKRYYPYNSLASTVLGFTGADDIGIEGLEKKYNDVLTGIPGRIIMAKNAAMGSMPIEYTSTYDAKQGTSLVLTIDETMQRLLEKELEEVYVSSKANAAYGLIMDVKTGGILAMSNQPDYDLNEPYVISSETVQAAIDAESDTAAKDKLLSTSRQAQWRNRTISDTYEPGSVFKIFTAAAGLEEGVVSEKTSYTCLGGIQVADNYIRCHKRQGHGTQNLTQGLMNSCNPFFITVGQKLGVEKFYKYFEAFGFTEKTGIDLSGEAAPKEGITYHGLSTMGISQLSSCAFGQSFQVSPIQVITGVSAIANGGKLMQPYIVAKQLDEDGNVIGETQPTVKRQVVSETTSKRVLAMMENVVSTGTGKNAYVAGYHVAGKTGTSQKLSKKGEYIASFVCVAPADDPQIAILIAIDEPKGEVNGGQIAAPVAGKLVEDIMEYLSVEPKYTEAEEYLIDVPVMSLTGKSLDEAKSIAKDNGFSVKTVGSGDYVLTQIPSYGQTIPQKGVVILYTENSAEQLATVPDFKGMSLTMARRTASDLGINLKVGGNATKGNDVLAYMQDVEVDTQVKYGSVVTVYFKSYSGVTDSNYG